MATIDLIVDVNIAAQPAAPSLPGVNVPGLIGYHTHWTDLIRGYSQPSDMISDGFTQNDPLYLMAAAMASQNPHINQFKVIRGTTAVAQAFTFKVTDTQTGHVVGMVLTKPDGTTVNLQHTNTAGQTAAQIATALQGTVIAGLTLTIDGGDNTQVDVAVTVAGDTWFPSSITGGTFTATTPSASPQTDLAAAALVDPNFYGVSGTWHSAANISAIAAWVEANQRVQVYTTADLNNFTLGQGIFSTLKTAGYNRSYGQYSGTPRQYGATALMGNRFTDSPGADTWAFVGLTGVNTDGLTTAQIQNATPLNGSTANNGNVYVPIGTNGVGMTLTGINASGLFMDVQIGIDALSRDVQLRIMTALQQASNAGKRIPYTRKGISAIANQLRASLQSFTTSGFLSDDVGAQYVVNVPDVTAATPSDKSKRILRNLTFTAVAQGAVQTVLINGNVSF